MKNYLFGHQTLSSSIDFKELPRLADKPAISPFPTPLRIESHGPREPAAHCWQHEWKEADDSITLSLASHEAGFLLRFPELCDFILDFQHRCISVFPHALLDEPTIEHLLVDQVLPRFLAHEGNMFLHACAVNVNGRIVLFLGKSGWGKSTLAALFHHNGQTLYSDDCVLLEGRGLQWYALATYPSLRLYEDSIEQVLAEKQSDLSPVSEYTDKQRVALAIDQDETIPPLHAMYFLSDPETATEQIQIMPMSPASTCIELIQRSFRLDLTNAEQTKTLMNKAAQLTKSLPAYRLSYPHDYQGNQALLALLIKHISQ